MARIWVFGEPTQWPSSGNNTTGTKSQRSNEIKFKRNKNEDVAKNHIHIEIK